MEWNLPTTSNYHLKAEIPTTKLNQPNHQHGAYVRTTKPSTESPKYSQCQQVTSTLNRENLVDTNGSSSSTLHQVSMWCTYQ